MAFKLQTSELPGGLIKTNFLSLTPRASEFIVCGEAYTFAFLTSLQVMLRLDAVDPGNIMLETTGVKPNSSNKFLIL